MTRLGLDFIYKAFTTTDIAAAIGGVRALGIRGCSVSMPFKEDVIPLVDTVEPSARAIHSVNTIVNDDGHLTASNTDYIAVQRLIDEHGAGSGRRRADPRQRRHGECGGCGVPRQRFSLRRHRRAQPGGRARAGRPAWLRLRVRRRGAHGADHRQRHTDRDGGRPGRERAPRSTTRRSPRRTWSSTWWPCRRRPR